MCLLAFESPLFWKGTGGAGAVGGLSHSSSCLSQSDLLAQTRASSPATPLGIRRFLLNHPLKLNLSKKRSSYSKLR